MTDRRSSERLQTIPGGCRKPGGRIKRVARLKNSAVSSRDELRKGHYRNEQLREP
jgi:hypothetical protein